MVGLNWFTIAIPNFGMRAIRYDWAALQPILEEGIGWKWMECKEYFKNMSFILLFESLSKRE